MHSINLPLWKLLLTIYCSVNSGRGASELCLAKLIGIFQKSAWKIGHAIRKMMHPVDELIPALSGKIELDEKDVGGKPRYGKGGIHPRVKAAYKQ